MVCALGTRHLMCDRIPAHGRTINGFERHDQADLLVFHAMPKILPVGGVLKDFVCPVLRTALRCTVAIWNYCIQQQFQMKSLLQVSSSFLGLLWSTTASAPLTSNKFVDSSNATGTESGYSVHVCQNL